MRVVRFLSLAIPGFLCGSWIAVRNTNGRSANPRNAATYQVTSLSPLESKKASASLLLGSGNDAYSRLLSVSQDGGRLEIAFRISEVLKDVTAAELPGFMERALKLPRQYREWLVPALLERWTELDPRAVEQWVMASDQNRSFWSKAWAQTDPKAAIAYAMQNARDFRNATLLSSAIEALAGNSPEAQARMLAGLPHNPLRDQKLAEVIERWSSKDVNAAKFLDQIPAGPMRDMLFQKVAANLGRIDPRKALELVDQQADGPMKQAALQDVLLAMTPKFTRSAIARVDAMLPSLQGGVYGNRFITRFAAKLAAADLAAARSWVDALPPSMGQGPMMAIGLEWAGKNPALALQWAQSRGLDVARDLHDTSMLGGYDEWGSMLKAAINANPKETVDWIQSQPAGPDRDRMMEHALFTHLFQNDNPEQLFSDSKEISWQLFTELPADAQPRAARAMGRKRARRDDFTDLQEWGDSFSSDAARDQAITGAMQAMARFDPDKADRLLNPITDPRERDAALLGIVQGMGINAPEIAATRATEINDPNMRLEALDSIVPKWLKRAPSDARAWFRAAQIPESQQMAWQHKAEWDFPGW